MSYWKLFVSGSFQGIDNRTVNQSDRVETRSRDQRPGLFHSLGVATVSLPASDQMALWILKSRSE